MSNKKLAILFILLAAFCSGGTSPSSKISLETIPPMIFTFFRFSLATIVITVFLYKEKVLFRKPTLIVVLLTLIQVINPIAFTYGVRLTTATISQTLFSATPILTAILVFFLMKESLPLQKILGIVIGFIGTMIIVLLPVFSTQATFNGNLLGNIFVSISVICLALYSVLSKRFHETYSPLYLTALFIYMTAIITGFFAIPEFVTHADFWHKTPISGWIGLFYSGAIGVLFFLFYQYAIKYGSPTIASVSHYISPVIAFLFASMLLGERLTFGFMIGALLIFIGVYLVMGIRFNKK